MHPSLVDEAPPLHRQEGGLVEAQVRGGQAAEHRQRLQLGWQPGLGPARELVDPTSRSSRYVLECIQVEEPGGEGQPDHAGPLQLGVAGRLRQQRAHTPRHQ